MRLILSKCRYLGRSRSLVFRPDPRIIIPGDKEMRQMQRQYRKFGKFVT